MIPIYQAVILGIVQGITEFLPISSTGHLRLIPRIFGWHDAGLAFDVALHTGTLLAILVYFRRDWADLIGPVFSRQQGRYGNLLFGIIIGCIPAAIAGKLLDDTIDRFEQTKSLDNAVMIVVASALILVGILLYAADRFGSKRKTKLAQIRAIDWITIGLAQAVALIPGVSRSGATITAGLARGLDRNTAARFSFLLSTPIFIGVAGLHILDLAKAGMPKAEIAPFIVGMVTSAVVGYAVIGFLLGFVRRHSYNGFVWYRIALGVAIFALVAARV